jgi:hypothetical protein
MRQQDLSWESNCGGPGASTSWPEDSSVALSSILLTAVSAGQLSGLGTHRSYRNAICFASLCQTLNSVRSGRVVSLCCRVNVDLRVATVAASSRKTPARLALRSVCLPDRVIRAVVNQRRRLQKRARPLRIYIASILGTSIGIIGCGG